MTLRIGIVNDLETARIVLRSVVQSRPDWQIAWEAHDGNEAVSYCAQNKPDLILMDLIMPNKSGVDATREIMAATPCAILVVTAGVDKNSSLAFEALAAGALDAANTPVGEAGQAALIGKIDIIAKLIGRTRRTPHQKQRAPVVVSDLPMLVAIGSSTGGPAALRTLLEELPADFPAALVIAQHLDEKFSSGMAEWLSTTSRMPVEVAKPGDKPEAGRVLLAATNDHLVMREDLTFSYTAEPVDQPYRPSVDEFFASVALYWKGPLIAVLLTGMGQDGARGLLALRRLGHLTLAQDKESSIVYGMPGTAARFGAAVAQMNPSEIGRELHKIIYARQNERLRGGQ